MLTLLTRPVWATLACISLSWALFSPDAVANTQTEEPVQVLMKTTMGDIVIELNTQKAPLTCANFLSYIDKAFYNNTIFHRVMPNFMIQGGGFTPDMKKKSTGRPIKNEWKNGLKNNRGTIAMARLGRRPDSATTQFFINVQNNPGLDRPRDGAGYAVFGKVIVGLEVVDRIRAVKTKRLGPHQNLPKEPVIIVKVMRLKTTDD